MEPVRQPPLATRHSSRYPMAAARPAFPGCCWPILLRRDATAEVEATRLQRVGTGRSSLASGLG